MAKPAATNAGKSYPAMLMPKYTMNIMTGNGMPCISLT